MKCCWMRCSSYAGPDDTRHACYRFYVAKGCLAASPRAGRASAEDAPVRARHLPARDYCASNAALITAPVLDQDRIEAAWRRRCVAQQVVARGKHHPLLLDCADAGTSTAKAALLLRLRSHKHHRTATFARSIRPPRARRPIICAQQLPCRLQIRQRLVFNNVAALTVVAFATQRPLGRGLSGISLTHLSP